MAVVFIEIGQDVQIEGENLEDAINEGVRQGYVDGYLRKSVVSDPIIRENTKDNTPAVIHYSYFHCQILLELLLFLYFRPELYYNVLLPEYCLLCFLLLK